MPTVHRLARQPGNPECLRAAGLLCGLATLLSTAPAQAFPVTFQFSGVLDLVTQYVDESSAGLAVGDAFQGAFTIDTDAPRAADGSFDGGFAFELDVGGWHFSRDAAGGPGHLSIQNCAGSSTAWPVCPDVFNAASTPTASPVFTTLSTGPIELVFFSISLLDSTAFAISDVADQQLPRNADFDLSKFDLNSFYLGFGPALGSTIDPGGPSYVGGTLLALSSGLPEPDTAALTLLALAATLMLSAPRSRPAAHRRR